MKDQTINDFVHKANGYQKRQSIYINMFPDMDGDFGKSWALFNQFLGKQAITCKVHLFQAYRNAYVGEITSETNVLRQLSAQQDAVLASGLVFNTYVIRVDFDLNNGAQLGELFEYLSLYENNFEMLLTKEFFGPLSQFKVHKLVTKLDEDIATFPMPNTGLSIVADNACHFKLEIFNSRQPARKSNVVISDSPEKSFLFPLFFFAEAACNELNVHIFTHHRYLDSLKMKGLEVCAFEHDNLLDLSGALNCFDVFGPQQTRMIERFICYLISLNAPLTQRNKDVISSCVESLLLDRQCKELGLKDVHEWLEDSVFLDELACIEPYAVGDYAYLFNGQFECDSRWLIVEHLMPSPQKEPQLNTLLLLSFMQRLYVENEQANDSLHTVFYIDIETVEMGFSNKQFLQLFKSLYSSLNKVGVCLMFNAPSLASYSKTGLSTFFQQAGYRFILNQTPGATVTGSLDLSPSDLSRIRTLNSRIVRVGESIPVYVLSSKSVVGEVLLSDYAIDLLINTDSKAYFVG